MADDNDPSVPSSDHNAMAADWQMIADIQAGARRIREAGRTYLPQYEKESNKGYLQRLASTPWRPEFVDALRNLCAKPFTEKCWFGERIPPPKQIAELAEDIDGRGNNLHVFARDAFMGGVAMGLEAIYVTFTKVDEPPRTVADERASGVRPYWVHVSAPNILALYTRKVNGREVVEHIRIKETSVERSGLFEEVTVERVRVLELNENGKPTWQLWTKGDGGYVADADPKVITLDEIPIVLFFTGERSGNYRVKPPLLDLAGMQMELYRALSRKDEVLTYAGSPMLKAVGMSPPQPELDGAGNKVSGEITVGPKTILFAPPAGEGVQPDWDFIQPAAENIKEVRADVDGIITDFRRLALQPTTPQSGTITATSTAVEAAKAHSAIEAWANDFKDALEQAFVYTCQWLKIVPDNRVEVSVHTDFGVDIEGGQDMAELLKARMAGEITRETYWAELKRRGKLRPEFDAKIEAEMLDREPVLPAPELDEGDEADDEQRSEAA